MDIDEFVRNFGEQLDETDVSTLSSNTEFKNLDEWSSLVALSIIAMVDEEYDVTIRGEDIRNSNTIEDLYNIIKDRA